MTDKAREQASGLDNWANVLEAHDPGSSAKGILMLRAAAKTLRVLAATADAPEGPWKVLNMARLYISALETAIQDYRGNPTSSHLDMVRDIVRNTGEDFRDALNRLHAQKKHD